MHCVIITNIPTPYRNPVYARLPAGKFTVLFCARTESNRKWLLKEPEYEHRFLSGKARALEDGYNFVHDNPDVWRELNVLQPDVVVITGLNPTHLRAYAWAKLHNKPHVYCTDGTILSEAGLSLKHRLMRRIVIGSSGAGIAASSSGCELLASYGLARDRIFSSPLCANNDHFSVLPLAERDIDVLWVGQFIERKLPMLFAQTCAALRQQRGRCRALVVGDGPMRSEVLASLKRDGVDVSCPGFVQPNDLPAWYARARLLLFTTRLDAWGVVANEAMAAGTPVLTSPYAGVVGDLVIDGVNGRVLPSEPNAWAEAARQLLDDTDCWQQFSDAALVQVSKFSFEIAAKGIADACARSLVRN